MARNRNQVLAEIEATGVVAVIRADSGAQLVDICRALLAGGVTACEITMTTPNAIEAIGRATAEIGDEAIIGVGTALDAETARAAILAGAQFVVSPSLDLPTIAMAHRYDRPVMPGALTPTEIVTAWSAGADIVKVFPANHFGPTYFKDLKGPLPHIRLTPTGGVDLTTAADWIKAGAACLGVGSALVKKEFIKAGDWAGLTGLARQYIDIVRTARG
jgi:2-dehydro-3-deoxyphosphogluconate aldolase / (4S)-4-hydroxy-2-oxoglutarate aldolase